MIELMNQAPSISSGLQSEMKGGKDLNQDNKELMDDADEKDVK